MLQDCSRKRAGAARSGQGNGQRVGEVTPGGTDGALAQARARRPAPRGRPQPRLTEDGVTLSCPAAPEAGIFPARLTHFRQGRSRTLRWASRRTWDWGLELRSVTLWGEGPQKRGRETHGGKHVGLGVDRVEHSETAGVTDCSGTGLLSRPARPRRGLPVCTAPPCRPRASGRRA